ncbi:hypothetical protein LCGC14_2560090, partial [marine sediment metagenome]
MIYQRDDEGRIVQSFEGDLMLRASKLNPVKNHALVEVLLRGARLAYDDLNVGTMAKRVTLTNAAVKQARAREQTIETSDGQLLTRLGEFCYGLWDFHVGDQVAVLTTGSAEPSTPPWLIEDVVLRGAGTILFAPPGQGKSYIGLLLAQSLNYGREELWNVSVGDRSLVRDGDGAVDPRDTAALYLNLERSQESLEDRLGNVNAALGLPRDAGMLMIHARGHTLEKVMDGAK